MKKILVPNDVQIAVIGDIHEHSEQFFKILDQIKPSKNTWIVSLGDVGEKGFGEKEFNSITDKLMELSYLNIGYACRGNHEIKMIKRNKNDLSCQLQWWKKQPLSITFEFASGALLTCLHAGVLPSMSWESIQNNTEVVYIRDIDSNLRMIPLVWQVINGVKTLIPAKPDGKSWHSYYDGRFGYIASGHNAQKDGIAKYYNYSCNLDSAVFDTGILTAQMFTSEGKLGEQITVTGTPFKPKLNVKE